MDASNEIIRCFFMIYSLLEKVRNRIRARIIPLKSFNFKLLSDFASAIMDGSIESFFLCEGATPPAALLAVPIRAYPRASIGKADTTRHTTNRHQASGIRHQASGISIL